jgi:HK97 family phage portal protein
MYGFGHSTARKKGDMKFFDIFLRGFRREKSGIGRNNKERSAEYDDLPIYDNFSILKKVKTDDSYFLNAWVNIAVSILIRNIARAQFILTREGNEISAGPLFELFRRPNEGMSRYDLWKETAAWWHLEGEACDLWSLRWFGPEYSAGIPKAIYILDPRRMRNEESLFPGIDRFFTHKNRRWFYQTDTEIIPILGDELIHFKDWNPWNSARGVSPLAALALELEQDYYANTANSQLLKNNAIPQGILKTDQSIRPEEADALERRWESKYGAVRANRKIAVLGKGTEFKPLSFTPEVVKLFELKRWNLYTILARYGIPPRVANISDKSTALSGKDTVETKFPTNNTPPSGSIRSFRCLRTLNRFWRLNSFHDWVYGSTVCLICGIYRNCKRVKTRKVTGILRRLTRA